MSRICTVCGKGSIVARKYNKLMSKYNPSPKSRRYPNLQSIYIPQNTEHKSFQKYLGKRVKICTQCMKTLGKIRKPIKNKEGK